MSNQNPTLVHFRHFSSLLTAYKAPGRPGFCPLIRIQIKVRPKGLHNFAFYILIFAFSLLPSTTVERPLQITSFMQNKANFQKAKMNVNAIIIKDYENETLGRRGKNKPNTKPIKANTNPISEKLKMNVSSVLTTYYENKSNWTLGENKPNQTQFQRLKNAAAFDD